MMINNIVVIGMFHTGIMIIMYTHLMLVRRETKRKLVTCIKKPYKSVTFSVISNYDAKQEGSKGVACALEFQLYIRRLYS